MSAVPDDGIAAFEQCRLDHYHNPGRIAGLEDDPKGLCYVCIRDRSYRVRRRLGEGYRGRVILSDGTTGVVRSWSNAGFRGIEIVLDINGQRVFVSAGEIHAFDLDAANIHAAAMRHTT